MTEPKRYSAAEIDALRSDKGGWTRAALAELGVPWPPPKGWRLALLNGEPIPSLDEKEGPPTEAHLLHKVVMAVINAGQNDILKGIEELNDFYGCPIPTVAQVIGGRPQHAIVTGDITFDDKVYSFKCARRLT